MSRYMTNAKSLAFLIAFGLSTLTGLAAEESYLYWMIDPDAISLLGNRWSVTPADNMTVKVMATDGSSGEALLLYYGGESAGSPGVSQVTGTAVEFNRSAGNVGFYASLGKYFGDGYSYYVEIFNSGNSVMTTESISYNEAVSGGYVANFNAGQGLSGMAIPWMAPAPEPNSALLLLLGCAVLGLKRKKA